MKVPVQAVILLVGLTMVSCQENRCFQNLLDESALLNSCFMESTNNTAEAFDRFCRMGNCSELVAQALEDCGRPGEATRFRTGCIQDSMGRFCMSVVTNSSLFAPAVRACMGTDCSDANCREAINELGCCITVSNLADFSDILPIEQCNVRACNSAGHRTNYSMVTMATTVVLMLLHFVQN